LLILVAAALVVLFYGDGLFYTWKHQKQVEALQARNRSLEELNRKMRQRIEGLKSGNKLTLEEEARYHGMVFDGETQFIVKPRKVGK